MRIYIDIRILINIYLVRNIGVLVYVIVIIIVRFFYYLNGIDVFNF